MDMTKITGLWKSEDKNGNTYLSGKMNAITQLMIMQNTYKKEDREPDYWLYIKPAVKKDKSGNKYNKDKSNGDSKL